MSDESDETVAFLLNFTTEAERLGLDIHDLPGLAFSGDAESGFESLRQHMRTLRPGATWRDVFPDMPAGWEDGQWEDRPATFQVLGPLDYQQPPAGALVSVACDRSGFETLRTAAREAGFSLFAAWVNAVDEADDPNDADSAVFAYLAFTHDGSAETGYKFLDWLERRPELGRCTGHYRRGDETYGASPDAP